MKKPASFNWWVVVLVAVISTVMVWAGAGMQTIYQNYDGPYYVAIAKSWYDQEIIRNSYSFPLPLQYYPAHFPLYPSLINLISLINLNHLQAMLLINLLATVVGSVGVFKIFEKMKWGDPLWASLAWLFIWPRMWAIRSVGSPETLFILFTVLSLY